MFPKYGGKILQKIIAGFLIKAFRSGILWLERDAVDCMRGTGIPAASTATTAVRDWLIWRKRSVGKDGGQPKARANLWVDQMTTFTNPA